MRYLPCEHSPGRGCQPHQFCLILQPHSVLIKIIAYRASAWVFVHLLAKNKRGLLSQQGSVLFARGFADVMGPADRHRFYRLQHAGP